MKKKKGKLYILTKIVKKRDLEYSTSFQKRFLSDKEAVEYAKENNYSIVDDLGKAIYGNEN
jgi:uncharacterized protein YjiK